MRKDAIRNLKNRLSNPGSGNSGLKEWSVVHNKATCFQETDFDGPAWNTVTSRTTYDLTSGNNRIIEHITIDRGVGAATLLRKQRQNVSHIRTVLQYKEESEENNVKRDILNSVRNPKGNNKKVGSCYFCEPVGHPTRNTTLANRREKGCKKSKDSHFKDPSDSGFSL